MGPGAHHTAGGLHGYSMLQCISFLFSGSLTGIQKYSQASGSISPPSLDHPIIEAQADQHHSSIDEEGAGCDAVIAAEPFALSTIPVRVSIVHQYTTRLNRVSLGVINARHTP